MGTGPGAASAVGLILKLPPSDHKDWARPQGNPFLALTPRDFREKRCIFKKRCVSERKTEPCPRSALRSVPRETSATLGSPRPAPAQPLTAGRSLTQAAAPGEVGSWAEAGAHSLGPLDLGVGNGTDEGHHPAIMQEEPHERDGCLLLLPADLTQDVRRGCRHWLWEGRHHGTPV